MMTIQNPWLMIGVVLCLSLVYCQPSFGGSTQAKFARSAEEHLRDRGTYIVCFKSDVTEIEQQHFVAVLETKSKTTKEFVAEIMEKFLIIKCLTVKLSEEALDWVMKQKSVLEVNENKYFNIGSENAINSENTVNPNSPLLMSPWHLDKIGQVTLSKKSNNTLTGKGIDVYVLDSGIHYEHEEFNGRALYPDCDPIDTLYGQSQAGRDCEGHGTHVAGLVGGKSTGVANGVTIFSVRILNCTLIGSEAALLHGLMCVRDHNKNRNGARAIINLSIASEDHSVAINRSIQQTLKDGIIIIASAGNGNPANANNNPFKFVNYNSCKVYPAGYPGVINVGATDINDNALIGKYDGTDYITNMGECLDVFAPGYKIYSSDICPFLPCTVGNDECNNKNTFNATCKNIRTGTSQSSPIVAGAVALLLEKCPVLTYQQIQSTLSRLVSTATVQFCKPFLFLKPDKDLGVIATITYTHNRSLYIGNLFDDLCSLFTLSISV